jgi:hypothetical protein
MGGEAMEKLWDRMGHITKEQLPSPARLILLAIAKHAEVGEWSGYPGIARMCRHAALGESTVHRYIAMLEADGYLSIRKNASEYDTNVYKILIKNLVPRPRKKSEARSRKNESTRSHNRKRPTLGAREVTPGARAITLGAGPKSVRNPSENPAARGGARSLRSLAPHTKTGKTQNAGGPSALLHGLKPMSVRWTGLTKEEARVAIHAEGPDANPRDLVRWSVHAEGPN